MRFSYKLPAITCLWESTEIPATKNKDVQRLSGFTPDGVQSGVNLLEAQYSVICLDGHVFNDETVKKTFKCVQNGSIGQWIPLDPVGWFGCRCMMQINSIYFVLFKFN